MAALIHRTGILVHGVDLAVVTGREGQVDQRQCAQLLTTLRAMDFDAFRQPGMFGGENPVADGTPAHRRRLLAFLGR